ncbi:MAG: hypothetical protein R6V25_00210 [Desulfatiglandales bacterium]
MILGHEKLDVYRCVKEDSGVHRLEEIDFDPDSDFDPEETKLDAHSLRQCSLTLGCGQGPALVSTDTDTDTDTDTAKTGTGHPLDRGICR